MGKQDYELIAKTIRRRFENEIDPAAQLAIINLAGDLADEFTRYDRFDGVRFLKACGTLK